MSSVGIIEPIVIVIIFIITILGGLIIYELKRIHSRIDKHTAELDIHVSAGVDVYTRITRTETALSLHMQNGHRHQGK